MRPAREAMEVADSANRSMMRSVDSLATSAALMGAGDDDADAGEGVGFGGGVAVAVGPIGG
jgi:hypothetical protein